ncbi:GntR family transcriptional regulator [Alcaligenaceae bacterium A4P071]|nr:GntR family transcriptional regulator [Alcaligenaceae bacterium A4P071]
MSAAPELEPFALTAEAEAYRYIHAAIRTGVYPPGFRLIPEDIAASIGTSRMPVREAFRRLASEGLVTIRPNRGAMVTGLSLDEMQEVFEMRAALEGMAVRLAAPHMTPANLAVMERMLNDMDGHLDNLSDWAHAHQNLHAYLCGLSQRPRLTRHIAALHTLIEPYMRLWIKALDRPFGAREHHIELLNALRSRDPDIAEAAMRHHVQATVPELMQFLASRAQTASS